jgi:DNA processing protein
VLLAPDDPAYPVRLANLDPKPTLRVSGALDSRAIAVAIVGSRTPVPEALKFARDLAGCLAAAGIVVVSGGAKGIDAAAHEAALRRGRTWCVAPSGRAHPYPEEHAKLFARIARSRGSRMIWPFEDDVKKDEETPKARNAVLVGLARAVVVVQAHLKSGSRNAMTHARRMNRPLLVVPGPPWARAFEGSSAVLATGDALPLCHPQQLFRYLGLTWPGTPTWWPNLRGLEDRPRKRQSSENLRLFDEAVPALDREGWTDSENVVFTGLSDTPQHLDEVVAKTGLSTSATITALLTLSLKDVVVEGPDGFFRRRQCLLTR